MTNKELQEQLKKYPEDMEVIFLTDYEVCGSDDHSYWRSFSFDISTDKWLEYNEEVHDDIDSLKEKLAEVIEDEHSTFSNGKYTCSLNDEEIELRVEEKFNDLVKNGEIDISDKILVRLST